MDFVLGVYHLFCKCDKQYIFIMHERKYRITVIVQKTEIRHGFVPFFHSAKKKHLLRNKIFI